MKLETGFNIIPEDSSKYQLRNYRVYTHPSSEQWRIGLLHSLIELREDRWHIVFDEEEKLNKSELDLMIEDVCTS